MKNEMREFPLLDAKSMVIIVAEVDDGYHGNRSERVSTILCNDNYDKLHVK